jgi:hypothetical protein
MVFTLNSVVPPERFARYLIFGGMRAMCTHNQVIETKGKSIYGFI